MSSIRLVCVTASLAVFFIASVASAAVPQWSTATLSEARGGMGSTAVDGLAIFAGGTLSGGVGVVPTDTVDIYEAATGAWTQASLSVPRSGIGAATVGHLAIFAGGSLDSDTASDAVDLYDASTGTWSTAQLSAPRTGVGATSVGRYAVFAGGSLGASGGGASDVVDVYDAVTGIWSTATIPSATTFVQAAPAGDRVVIFTDDGFSPLLFFNPADGSSVELARPAQLGSDVVVVLAVTPGAFWLVSGAQFMFPFTTRVLRYDLAAGTWSEPEMLSEARLGVSVGVTSTKLIAAGGLVSLFPPFDSATVDLFDLQGGEPTSAALSVQRYIPNVVEVDGQVLFAGGFRSGSTGSFTSDAVDIYSDTVGAAYCTPAVPNSTGAFADIRMEGAPGTLADGTVALVSTGLPEGSSGYFLASLTTDVVPGAGGSQGTLCLGGSIGRYAATPFFTGFDGESTQSVDLANLPAPMGSATAMLGETWFFQAWYRDANPGATTNFTSGVSLLIQ